MVHISLIQYCQIMYTNKLVSFRTLALPSDWIPFSVCIDTSCHFNSFFSCMAYSLIMSCMLYGPDEVRCMTMHRKIEFSNVINVHLEMSNAPFAQIYRTCLLWYDLHRICSMLVHGVSRANFIKSYNGIHTFLHSDTKRTREQSENHLVSVFVISECSTAFCQ